MTTLTHAKLGDIAQYVRGINFKPDDVKAVGAAGTVACMRTKNIQDSLDCSDVWGVAETFVRRPEQILQEGDMLVSSANSWNLVGKCCWIPDLPWKTTFGGFVSALRANPMRVNPRYLYWWFSSDRTQALLRSFGRKTTSISNLSAEQCLNLSVPLPPLPEQRRIAAILDQADALRAKRREALAQLDSLTQSLFIEMFGDPVSNPKGWPTAALGAHVCKLGSGSTPTGGDAAYKESGISLIRSLNVHDGEFTYKNLAFIDETQAAKLSNVVVAQGDVLLNITGASVARVCSVPGDVLPARVNQHVMIIRPTPTLNRLYLERLLLNPQMKTRLLQIGGAGATREAITKVQAAELVIPVPPISIQDEFAKRLATVQKMKSSHKQSLGELNTLFASLQHRAFRGEL